MPAASRSHRQSEVRAADLGSLTSSPRYHDGGCVMKGPSEQAARNLRLDPRASLAVRHDPQASLPPRAVAVPRRELVTLLAYLATGSHPRAAHRLGISSSTSRQRMSTLIGRLGVDNAAQATWVLRCELELEGSVFGPGSRRTADDAVRGRAPEPSPPHGRPGG
jgi:hypothetical protein